MAVPAFFMVSGFLLGLRPAQPGGGGGVMARLGQRLRLFDPFFAWNLIYMIRVQAGPRWPISQVPRCGSYAPGYSHLWFVCVLVQLLLLYAWLQPA